jgi:exonuclease SbcC
MKNVELKLLRLHNFKGVRDLTVNFEGNMSIMGANKTGKSTIFDAAIWLLFGKDQFDRENYEIKTLDESGKVIEKIDHEVEGWFKVNEVLHKPKRIYREIWRKEHGEKTKTFKGHEVVYFWNDVPQKASEFKSAVNEIITEELFKLLTNTLYFNTNVKLGWTGRRAILLDIAGKITDDEIADNVSTDKETMKELITRLTQYKNVEDFKKAQAVKRNKIKSELERIPIQMEEADLNKPQSFDFPSIEAEINSLELKINEIDSNLTDKLKLNDSQNAEINDCNKAIQSEKRKLSERLADLQAIIINSHKAGGSEIPMLEQSIRTLNNALRSSESALITASSSLNALNVLLNQEVQMLNELRASYKQEFNSQFVFNGDTCPACSQLLPEHEVEIRKQEMLGKFNIEKNKSLQQNKDSGIRLSDIHKKRLSDKLNYENQINELKLSIESNKEHISLLNTKLSTQKLLESKNAEFDLDGELKENELSDTKCIEIKTSIATLEKRLDYLTGNLGQVDVSSEKLLKQELSTTLNTLKTNLANKAIIETIDLRIKELDRQEIELSQALADLENIDYSVEQYMKSKMDILESRINHKFKYVTFKLFNRQINNAEVETCECLVNGVPFGAVNTAGKTNAGLDIINVLCEHYGVTAPVFIDNRESITNIIETKSQIINLIVDPSSTALKVIPSLM